MPAALGAQEDASSPDASDSGGPASSDVTGIVVVHYATDNGIIDRPMDLSRVSVTALAERVDGSFAVVSGSGRQDGHFVALGVPNGAFDLRFDPPQRPGSSRDVLVLVHPSRDLELDAFVAGRPDAEPASILEFELRVNNLAPWSSMPPLFPFLLVSSNAGCLGSMRALNPSPMAGQTSLYDVAGVAQANAAVDAADGDRAALVQMATMQRTGGESDEQVVRVLDISSPEWLPPPSAATIEGDLVEVAPTQQLRATRWDLQRFAPYAPGLAPGAKQASAGVVVQAFPTTPPPRLAASLSILTQRADEVSLPLAAAGTSSPNVGSLGALAFGNPFPGWTMWIAATYTATSTVHAEDGDGGTFDFPVSGGFTRFVPFAGFDGSVEPMLVPPSNVRIGGADAFSGPLHVGVSPTFTWTAARSLDPNFGAGSIVYDLVLEPIGPASTGAADAGSTDGGLVRFTFRTSETTVVIPPGLLVAGQAYVAALHAIAVAGSDATSPSYDEVHVETAAFTP